MGSIVSSWVLAMETLKPMYKFWLEFPYQSEKPDQFESQTFSQYGCNIVSKCLQKQSFNIFNLTGTFSTVYFNRYLWTGSQFFCRNPVHNLIWKPTMLNGCHKLWFIPFLSLDFVVGRELSFSSSFLMLKAIIGLADIWLAFDIFSTTIFIFISYYIFPYIF